MMIVFFTLKRRTSQQLATNMDYSEAKNTGGGEGGTMRSLFFLFPWLEGEQRSQNMPRPPLNVAADMTDEEHVTPFVLVAISWSHMVVLARHIH